MAGFGGGISAPSMQTGIASAIGYNRRIGEEERQRQLLERDLEAGRKRGEEMFMKDPEMQAMRKRREELAQGYSAPQLAAFREQARASLAGEQSNILRQMAARQARGGVGGARAAAGQAAASTELQGKRAEMERGMTIAEADRVAQQTQAYQDFIMRQRYGVAASELGRAQLAVAQRGASEMARIAGQQRSQGLAGEILSGIGFA